ncbi:hypothetical protein C0993_005807 [Termitomyces sp. T159_Od127]|nr:hypothetical protein C0993_005807 [Termitomyces sp. T159_Od127]
MSLDIFQEVYNECLERLKVYGTPAAIPQWDTWCKISEEGYYCLLFKHAKEGTAGMFPEATGLYYYIGMDQNSALETDTADCEMVDATAAGGSMTPLRKDSKPLSPTINVTTGEEAKTTDMGGSPPSA